jgi:hypothetical protein
MSNLEVVLCILFVLIFLLVNIAYWAGRARQIQIFIRSQKEIITKLEEDVTDAEKDIARIRSRLETES